MSGKQRLMAVLVAVGMLFSMTACGSGSGQSAADSEILPSNFQEALDQQQELPADRQPENGPLVLDDAPPILVVNWTVAIEGVDGIKEYTCDQAADLGLVQTTATVDGVEAQYTGVRLYLMLDDMGAKGFSSVTLESGSGTVKFDSAAVSMDEFVVAWAKNGEPLLDDSPVWVLPGGDQAPVVGLTKIIVEQ